MTFRLFLLVPALLLCCIPCSTFAQETSEMQQAIADAEKASEKYVSPLAWGAVGYGCGCFGIAYAYFSTPEVPVGLFIGKTETYISTYTQVYQERVKRRRLNAAVIGCGLSSVTSAISWLIVGQNLDTD